MAVSVRAPAFPRMRIAPDLVANGARLRANGAREVEIQIAPAKTDANAFALGYCFPLEMP